MVLVTYQNIENSKEATRKVFRDSEARSKVQIKHFKVKIIGVCYI